MTIPSMQDLLESGVHFGHQVRRGNPRMGQYIFGVRDGVHIINLEDSEKLLKEAVDFVKGQAAAGKIILFVGSKKQAQELIKENAQKINMPYVDYKWMPGFLTNFTEMRKNIKKLLDLKEQQAKGELDKYTKREQLLISRKLEKFEKEYGGVAKVEVLPDALFIIDLVHEGTALTECVRMKIPVVGICDTNSNPSLVEYPIPGNDDAIKSIKILTETIFAAFAEGLRKVGKSSEKMRGVASSGESPQKLPAGNEQKETGPVKSEPQTAEEVAAIEEEVEKEEVEEAKTVV